MSPQVVDFDGDGKPDIIGGTFEGFVYFIQGKENGLFEEPRKMKDRNGNLIHLGMFWDYKDRKWTTDKTIGTNDHGVYPLAVDWDGDGDMDLLFGGTGGSLGIRLNEGTREKARFSEKNSPVTAGKNPIKLRGWASPSIADWDGDGRWDLLCADSSGRLFFYRNLSKEGVPVFEEPETVFLKHPTGLIEREKKLENGKVEKRRYSHDYGRPSEYIKLAVGDVNNDGKMDVIVGAWDQKKKGHLWLFSRK